MTTTTSERGREALDRHEIDFFTSGAFSRSKSEWQWQEMQNRHLKYVWFTPCKIKQSLRCWKLIYLNQEHQVSLEGHTEASNFTQQVQTSMFIAHSKIKAHQFHLFPFFVCFPSKPTLKCVKGAIKRLNYTAVRK